MFRSGERIDGRYRVVRELGCGGYGTVYLAEELDSTELLGWAADEPSAVLRPVAVKVMNPRKPNRRFSTEVRALCRLSHPGIVTVFGYGLTELPDGFSSGGDGEDMTWPEQADGTPAKAAYVAMEYVDGATLAAESGPRGEGSLQRRIGLLIHVAEALGHAHAHGVVHRDLKPANILVGREGLPRIVDFGLSWLLRNEDPASQHVGTPGYLAPELLAGSEATRDHRADIYGFGATAYALFVGRSPFATDGLFATVRRQLEGDWTFPDDFPVALRSLVRRCLAVDPLDRPRAAALIAEELRRIATQPSIVVAGASTVGRVSELEDFPDRLDVRDARVARTERFDHPTRGAGLRLELVTGDGGRAETLRGFTYAEQPRSAARRTHDVLSWVWEGAELSLYSVRGVGDSQGRRFVAADGTTVPVLEPYFPVSVTDVSKADGVRCGPCATRVLVDARKPREPGRSLVVGSLAHDMLDRMVRSDGRIDFDSAFDASFASQRLEAIAAGLRDGDIDTVRNELREHFEHLSRWTEAGSETRQGLLTEVKRFSSRYGLEGRIDLCVVDDDAARIVELKTGRFESPEHERQLRCYTLMWDAIAAGRARRVDGVLLYSLTGKRKPLLRRSHELEREVVGARNDIVAMHRWFSDGDTAYRPPSFMQDPALCGDSPCRWRRDDCAFQTALLGGIAGTSDEAAIDPEVWRDVEPRVVRATRSYYFHFLRLIEREYRAASRAMGAVFRRATVDERAASLRAVADATLDLDALAPGRVAFRCDAWGVFDEGDEVLAHRGDFDSEPCLSGRVVERTADRLVLACDGADAAVDLPTDGWVLDRDVLRIGFRAMHQALFSFVAARDPRRLERIVLPHLRNEHGQRRLALDAETVEPVDVHGDGDRELNPAQRRAVAEALRDHDAFLIHGPPGTGKTTVIAELVGRLVADGQRVLVAAFTHTAVDTVLSKVVGSGVTDVLRVGPRQTGGDLDRALRCAGLDPGHHYSSTLARAVPELERLRHRVVSAAVVAATTNACVTDPVFAILATEHGDAPPFDVAIIDEASQLAEPLALGAINRAARFVLVGDDHQLPPVVTAPDATSAHVLGAEEPSAPELEGAGLGGLDRSLFERLRPFVPHVFLSTQYRMNAEVQAMPNAAFYGRKLVPAPQTAGRRLALRVGALGGLDPELARRLDPAEPTVWASAAGEGAARLHPGEAHEVVRTVRALVDAWPEGAFDAEAIGVVSPFRAQCHAIRVGLREALGDAADLVEVDTVERFQGREKEVMLVSLVASEWSDFVMNPNRLNVTLTRARSKVVVFGSAAIRARLADVFAAAPPPDPGGPDGDESPVSRPEEQGTLL